MVGWLSSQQRLINNACIMSRLILLHIQSNGNAVEERERKVTILDSHDNVCRATTAENEA